MTNPRQPDFGVWMLLAQAIRGYNGVLADGPASADDINGDDLPNMVVLHLMSDVPLVYLVAKTGCLLSRTVRRRRASSRLIGAGHSVYREQTASGANSRG